MRDIIQINGSDWTSICNILQFNGSEGASDIIKINGSEGASIRDIININGSEGASIRDINKTSFLNVLGHFQRTLLFDHEKSDIIKINGSDE